MKNGHLCRNCGDIHSRNTATSIREIMFVLRKQPPERQSMEKRYFAAANLANNLVVFVDMKDTRKQRAFSTHNNKTFRDIGMEVFGFVFEDERATDEEDGGIIFNILEDMLQDAMKVSGRTHAELMDANAQYVMSMLNNNNIIKIYA